LDWLPSRLLLLSFAVLGDFERTRTVLTTEAFDQSVANDVLLATGVERAGSLDLDRAEDVGGAEAAVSAVEAMQKALTRAIALWIALASVVALI
jgi:membrane protein required for beta-lactamase induction